MRRGQVERFQARPAKRCNSCTVTAVVSLMIVASALTQWLYFSGFIDLLRGKGLAGEGSDVQLLSSGGGLMSGKGHCRFMASFHLLQQVSKAASIRATPGADSTTSSHRENSTCVTVESACHEDAVCHVNQWEATLAKPICQRERLKGCAGHQRGAGKINPEFCNHCAMARQADQLKCAITRSHCEAAMRGCFNETANATDAYGSLTWLSFWDENAYNPSEFLGWANFGFSGNVSRICDGAALGMQHLLKVNSYFFRRATESFKGKRRLELQPEWRTNWDSVRPLVASLLSTGAIFGIYLGDELIWNGLPPHDLDSVASLIRRDFPATVIWLNEARPPFKNGVTQFTRHLSFTFPAAITWVSTDSYHFEPDPEHVVNTRRFYNRYIYPKLLPNQSVVLVPGAYSSRHNPSCDMDCYEAFTAADAVKYIEWARIDPKVVAVVPYHWNNCPYCVHTQNEIGVKHMNKTRRVWQNFGRDLQASLARRLANACHSELLLRSGSSSDALNQCLARALTSTDQVVNPY